MSSSSGLARAQADWITFEVIAAWPGSPPLRDRYESVEEARRAARSWWEHWPSGEWRREYLDVRHQLLAEPENAEPADLVQRLFALQIALRDALEDRQPTPDLISAWEESFAALGRAITRAEAATDSSRAAKPTARSRRGRKP